MATRVLTSLRILTILLALGIPGWVAAAADVVSPRLTRILGAPAGETREAEETFAIWVNFTDRNLDDAQLAARLQEEAALIPERTLNRRAKAALPGQRILAEGDLPVAPEYLAAVSATGAQLRRSSRWLNAGSFNATVAQIEVIKELSFVAKIDLVTRFSNVSRKLTPEELAELEANRAKASADKNNKWSLDYGGSLEQAEMINLPRAHEMGLSGKGVIIGVIDTGFEFHHQSLQNVDVIAAYDFINDDSDVTDGPGDPVGQSDHGTEILSLLAGFSEGDLVAAAYNGSFILAKTEAIDSEDRQEEDNFIAALEWMEGLGVDVVSSQVGYIDWYTYSDLDGVTAPITIASDMAVSRGVCVVTAAGDLNGQVGIPPMMAPADGRNVITVGMVYMNGEVVSSSSRGPTYDGRIKPDVMALGFGAIAAYWYNDAYYPYVAGTGHATAQVAGVAALMLEENPRLTPWQIREALRMTGSEARYPDNNHGWGTVDAKAAIQYWGPSIEHQPLGFTDNATQPRTVSATVSSRQGLASDAVVLYWRVDQGSWQPIVMTPATGGVFNGEIPAAPSGAVVEYYLDATDNGGLSLKHPMAGGSNPHQYEVGVDGEAPTLDHIYLMSQLLTSWPPTLVASASDNVGIAEVAVYYSVSGGQEQGPFPLAINGEDYELEFPLDAGGLAVGNVVSYRLSATDASANGNTTDLGPFDFEIVAQRARVLLIDDLTGTKALEDGQSSGHAGAEETYQDKALFSPELIRGFLVDAGYQVDTIPSDQVKEGSFEGYPVVILSSGQGIFPIAPVELRAQLIAYAEAGGRLMIEGGEIAYVAGSELKYPEFFEKVLHLSNYSGEDGFYMHPTPGSEDHVFHHRPNRLPNELWMGLYPGNSDYRATDMVEPAPGAALLYSGPFASISGGIVYFDDNTGPDQGQVVYFPLALNFLKDAVGRMLVENAMAYLLTPELPGRSAITGQVLLEGASDHSGISVGIDSLHVTVTDADGYYSLEGLWGGDVTLTAALAGYGSETLDLHLVDDQTYPAETLTLIPITVLDFENTAAVVIPDNDPTGIESTIMIPTPGTLHSLVVRVDISHYSINNLVVSLTSPAGTSVTLHNRSGGTADNIVGSWPDILIVDGPGLLEDFRDESILGTWTLHVSDNAFGGTGTLNNWGLTIEAGSVEPSPVGAKPGKTTRIVGNSPNPFNPRTVISFEVAAAGRVNLNIYDLRGRLVRNLANEDLPAGRHEVIWDGLDQNGNMSASGVYFTKLQAAGANRVNKMTLVR